MKRQSKVLLAGILALGAFACFNDPTSDLRNGPAQLRLSRAAATIINGDSIAVTGTLVDAQGNALPTTGATWTVDDPTLVRVTVDTLNPAPGDIFTRAFVTAISNQPGVAVITATAGGQTATFHATVLPATFPGTAAVTGTPGADTIIINNPAPAPPTVVSYTAGDTLVVTAPANVTFANNATVTFGTNPAMIVSNTGTVIKALARAPYAGKVTIGNLVYAGNTTTGPIAIASIKTDSIIIEHARWRGTQAVTADPNFGANTLLTVTAPAGVTFGTGTTVAIGGTPVIGATAAVAPVNLIRLTQTATTLTAIAPSNQTGALLIKGALIGTAAVDSLRVGTAPLAVTITKSSFPGTVSQTGTGTLLDTVTISVVAGVDSFVTGPAASVSNVTIGGRPTFVLSRSKTQMKVIAKAGSTGPATISNVVIVAAGTVIPSLATSGNVVVTTSPSGEPNEPGNQSQATATALGTLSAANDSLVVFGVMNFSGDARDYYSFLMNTTGTVSVQLDFYGTGVTGDDTNPDFDVVVCTAASEAAGAPAIAGTCDYNSDILLNVASVSNQPEKGTTPSIAAGTTVFVRTYSYMASNAGIGTYRLRVKTP
jgi:hypothetical protein